MRSGAITRPWRRHLLAVALGTWLSAPTLADDVPERARTDGAPESTPCAGAQDGRVFQRTALFFGRSSPHGRISQAQFQAFLDTVVTPLFPEGLTVLEARGQFRDSADAPVEKEDSKVVILLYPFSPAASRDVDEIRSRYKARFAQRSVLRVDERSCVSF